MTADTFDEHPTFSEDYMRAYILVLFLFYNILSNSLKIGHLYKQQMVNIKAENMISQNIPFSIKQ